MKKLVLPIIMWSIIIIPGCSSNTDCFTSDNIDQIKVFYENGKKHTLFLRVSGLQEKEAFFELYSGAPAFDNCGQPSTKPLSMVHVDSTQGAVSKVVVEEEKLVLVYNAFGSSQTNPKDVFVEIK